MNVKLLTEHHLEFLSIKGGCTCSSESTLVKMPHCWKSHAVPHFSAKTHLEIVRCLEEAQRQYKRISYHAIQMNNRETQEDLLLISEASSVNFRLSVWTVCDNQCAVSP